MNTTWRLDTHVQKTPYAWLAMLALIVTGLWFGLVARNFVTDGVQSQTVGAILFRFDGISLLVGGLTLMLTACVMVYSFASIAGQPNEDRYYASLILMNGAIIGLSCAADLFNLWVWFELMTISSYLLVMFEREQAESLEAGLKYLVQSAIGSAFILFGIAVVIAETGTTNLNQISLAQPLAVALLVVGFGVKIAMVPLHMWLPDAHSQAPSGISAMLSGIVIEAALVALLRILPIFSLSAGTLLMAFGAINMLFGNLMALPQVQVKRLLAYSSISHVGYILLGIGIGLYSHENAGAGFFHLFAHGLMKGLAFLAAGTFLYALHQHSGKHLLVNDLSGAARRYPITALTLTVALLGLSGLPPLAGFMSKWQIFVAGFETQDLLIELLVLFAAFNSILSLGYYIPLINKLYRQKMSPEVERGLDIPKMMIAPLCILAVAILIIGVLPGLMGYLNSQAGSALLAAFGQ